MAKGLTVAEMTEALALAGGAATIQLIGLLWAKGVLSDEDARTVMDDAANRLDAGAPTPKPPTWKGAADYLRLQAAGYQPKPPGTKPS